MAAFLLCFRAPVSTSLPFLNPKCSGSLAILNPKCNYVPAKPPIKVCDEEDGISFLPGN
jgi:hypothetical protein